MLSSTLFGAFATPVTYALLFVLLSTAVMQVRYLNKALARFDSTQVIPIQFVSFTLSVIIGSAVLYRDFERTSRDQAIKFVGGCLLTFFGVFLITSGRPRQDEDEDTLSDVEGVEETIGLAEQGHAGPQSPHHQSRRGSASGGSRRSSRASRVSFRDTINRPLAAIAGTGFPTQRGPPTSSRAPVFADSEEDAPLPGPAWRESVGTPQHRGVGAHTLSSETVPSVVSNAVSDSEEPDPHQPTVRVPSNTDPVTPLADRPVTPRAPLSSSRPQSHHFPAPMISPSPFSSTVTAVVADKLLAHMDSPTPRRSVAARRSRAGLRNSLFMPLDDGEGDGEGGGEIPSAVDRRPDEAVLFHDDVLPEEDGKKGVRGRARSLSHTLGELFGVRRGRRSTGQREGEGEGLLGGPVGGSTDTL